MMIPRKHSKDSFIWDLLRAEIINRDIRMAVAAGMQKRFDNEINGVVELGESADRKESYRSFINKKMKH